MTSYDERATVIFNEILSLIDELNIKNHITRCDRDRYEIDLTSEYDDCKINLAWTDYDNVNIAYTPMFTSVNGQWNQGKTWSNTRYVEDVKNRLVEWAQNLQNPVSEAKYVLTKAIRERDEKIAAEEARKRAEEEKELARKKAEEERIRLENEKNFQEFELIKKFVDEIGDFEVKVPSNEGDGTFTYMSIRQVISFETCSGHGMTDSYLVNFGYHMSFNCDNSTSLIIKYKGYEGLWQTKKIIVDWAVQYGAREPELAQVENFWLA